jgi:hypothetical protein
MTRYPSVARAVHQLERHRSGTPNDLPPALPSSIANLVAFNLAGSEISTKLIAGLASWGESLRRKPETT